MSRQVLLMKIASLWPANWWHCLFTDIISLQITIYYLITFIKLILENGNIIEITDAITSTIIYAFVAFVEIYFQVMNPECKKIINYMKEKFRMRSAIGEYYCFLNLKNGNRLLHNVIYSYVTKI